MWLTEFYLILLKGFCVHEHCFFCCWGCHCSGYRFVGNSDISLQLHNRSRTKLGMLLLCSGFKVSHSFASIKRLHICCDQSQKVAQGRGCTHAQRVTTTPWPQKYMAFLSEVYCFRSNNLH